MGSPTPTNHEKDNKLCLKRNLLHYFFLSSAPSLPKQQGPQTIRPGPHREQRASSVVYWSNSLAGDSTTLTDDSGSTSLKGVEVSAGLGTQLDSWVRVEGYGLYRNLSNGQDDSLFGPELGLDLALSFSSPVVNINFGLGAEGASLARQAGDKTTRYAAQGVLGFVSLERFIGPQAAVSVGAKEQEEVLVGGKDVKHPKLSSSAVTLGLTLWMH